MQVRDVMTADPACCTPNTALSDIALLMIDNDCGEIPVVDDLERRHLVGVVTDRDIVCRAVAEGKGPKDTTAADVMTDSVITVREDAGVDDCCKKMETHQVRRVPVVDEGGGCCGIVAQADIARDGTEAETAEVVKDVSQANDEPSNLKSGCQCC